MPKGVAFFHGHRQSELMDTSRYAAPGWCEHNVRLDVHPCAPLSRTFQMSSYSSLGRALCLLGLAAITSQSACAGSTNVGVSVSVAQPGFYGRVDIGDQQPTLIYPQPVIIQQAPVAVHQRPIYLRVPPGHSRNWARYCGQYRACGQPVYFVREDSHRDRDERRDWDRRDHERYDQDGRDDDRGHGRGRGHGHGRGHD